MHLAFNLNMGNLNIWFNFLFFNQKHLDRSIYEKVSKIFSNIINYSERKDHQKLILEKISLFINTLLGLLKERI